jgi:hypothetical protein
MDALLATWSARIKEVLTPEVAVVFVLLCIPLKTVIAYRRHVRRGIVDYSAFASGVVSRRWLLENVALLFLAGAELSVLLLRAVGARQTGIAAGLSTPFLLVSIAVTVSNSFPSRCCSQRSTRDSWC